MQIGDRRWTIVRPWQPGTEQILTRDGWDCGRSLVRAKTAALVAVDTGRIGTVLMYAHAGLRALERSSSGQHATEIDRLTHFGGFGLLRNGSARRCEQRTRDHRKPLSDPHSGLARNQGD